MLRKILGTADEARAIDASDFKVEPEPTGGPLSTPRAAYETWVRLFRARAFKALYLTHTKLDDRMVLRFCVGATMTERRHVEAAWEAIRRTMSP